MVVLAVLAAGFHAMSIAAPALAEQERQARSAEAAAERAVVPNPAAADGLPVPALLGGIVLAFAVGLSAGQIQRRRRLARRAADASARPAPASLPVRPAPPPPEPTAAPEPRPVQLAVPEVQAPPPPPPPTPVRPPGPRILRFRPAPVPPPPEPDDVVEPPETVIEQAADEVVEPPTPEPVFEGTADEVVEPEPLIEGTADEVVEPPSDEVVEPPAHEPVAEADEVVADDAGGLESGPEVSTGDESRPAPAAVPARRFARARAWPEDAEKLWTCELAWKAGYVKSTFRAMAGPPGAGRRKSIAESPSLRWTLMTDPEPPTPEMIASVKVLVSALVTAGWERTGSGGAWYAQRFVWRGSGEPGAVEVPDEIESAEQPHR